MTGPTPPGRRGRHASPESPSGVPASAWLASMPSRPPGGDEGRHPGPAPRRRRADERSTGPLPGPAARAGDRPPHPSEPLPDLPPMPAGAWSRLSSRRDGAADDATVGLGGVPAVPGAHPDDTAVHRADPHEWDDADSTGGLEVLGASGSSDVRRRRRDRRAEREHHADEHHADGFGGEEPPGGGRSSGRPRRRRSPLAVVLSLLVLAGLVAGIFYGGKALIGLVNPGGEDYTGQGSGSVEVRVSSGDTLSDIARTLVAEGVIASPGPFVDAAETEPAATGIQPGVYALRSQMSGAAALDLLLDPEARQVTRVTVREGLTVAGTVTLLSEETGTPLAELQAVAADPVALGLPAYANGVLEGFLFPATYDFEPGDTPADMLGGMVRRTDQALDALQVPEADRLTVLTKASIVQAEAASPEDMAMVARVLENRLADGMPLQLDTTVNYANGKSGITTTPQDRANPSPYNTYVHAGLPPGAICNPGEQAIEAVLAPAPGDWRFFVVIDPDTGETRFARTAEEHQQNVLLFQQWLREQPGG
ncbi:endolytic transglycosylase MltG [Geodermatophilus obscurus]|uniref:Endolytic murein transglycosylase n=1 Tax=Geodermatophilus obscurus (strain ATCC 25078 / DSM 43160 / JCM 3152 / CCUG 61914 / KCC A-0152 / KCTC 9177 / NBRC 13315 / NRRL B-3577 / G-20) TaxID=526225 RepID=D2S9G2_GEOOG|nr:endolytic transglycosylase MltG [Geodermatophilus obscurus]ADB75762.1 aminodeoxychorismate lyase [Geodermatophilus obscurus DSM 43160]